MGLFQATLFALAVFVFTLLVKRAAFRLLAGPRGCRRKKAEEHRHD